MYTHEIVIMVISFAFAVIFVPGAMLWAHFRVKAELAQASDRLNRSDLLDRVHWLVAANRAGGYWAEMGEESRRQRQGIGGPVIERYLTRMRWVSL